MIPRSRRRLARFHLSPLSILRAHAEPALVFTRFRETLEHVVAALTRAKMLVHVLRGGMSAEERAGAIEGFRSRGGVLVATGVGSEGTNLQFARRLVSFDLPWNPRGGKLAARALRIGARSPSARGFGRGRARVSAADGRGPSR